MSKMRKNFPHDMGGQNPHEGAVIPDIKDAKVFKEPWHGRALAITILAGAHGKWNLDESRHARETLPQEDYRNFSYYEKWMGGLANLLVKHGLVDTDELIKGHAHTPNDADEPLCPNTLRADMVRDVMDKGTPTTRPSQAPPKFKIGNTVMTTTPDAAAMAANGHTRLPAYVAAKTGVIVKHYNSHILPDSHAHGMGEAPTHLYAVEFSAVDLWGNAAKAGDMVVVDCWESYLK